MSSYPLHEELLRTNSNDLLLKVQTLINAGASVNQLDHTQRSPLECCLNNASHTRVVLGEVIDLLLKKGADPDLRDRRGWSLLHQAAWKGDLFFIKKCVQLGRGDLQACNHDDQQPVHLAALKGHTHTAHYLDGRSGDLRCMCRAVIRTALGKRCHQLDQLHLPPHLKLFLNYNIPYSGFSAVLVPPEPWTPAQLHGKEVEGKVIQEFIRDHASKDFLETHAQELGEGHGAGPGEGERDLVHLFQEMYLWESFKTVEYEEPLPRPPRYSLHPLTKNKADKT